VVLDVDPKHPEALEWLREQQDIHGPFDTLEVSTPSGGSHFHFTSPEGIRLKSTASQIAPGVDTRAEGGYIIIPPSRINGIPYEVVNDVPPAPLPDWLLAIWPKAGERKHREHSPSGRVNGHVGGANLLNTPLPDGQRNTGLARVAGYLWNHPEMTLPDLEAELLDANARLCSPLLPEAEVLAIAQSISRYPKGDARVTDNDVLTWAEVQEIASYSQPEPFFKEGADSPRCRFPHHTDWGAISNLRNRLIPIWLENRLLEGDQKGYDRAIRCGELQARKCKKCGVVQCDGQRSRYTCKQRMCPRCMGTLARKPLWKKQEQLEQEADLTIFIPSPGSYYLGNQVNQWGAKAREIVGLGYQWLAQLTKRKDCPDTVKTSFAGFRADLHQGYLTLDLVLLGPNSFGAAAYLRNFFEQATEREVDIEVIPCYSTEETVNVFGNLMSSMAVYGNHEECQTLMTAFKRRRLIQGRGRFIGDDPLPEEGDEKDVSNISSETILETSFEETHGKGGGRTPPPCHECGGETEPLGRRTGNWKKVKGEFSGQIYWHLFDDPPEQQRLCYLGIVLICDSQSGLAR
jgi:hypothetical protein